MAVDRCIFFCCDVIVAFLFYVLTIVVVYIYMYSAFSDCWIQLNLTECVS